jgi:hypothetical protein
MRKILHLFAVRQEERYMATGILVYLLILNALVVCHYAGIFIGVTSPHDFIRYFHISGFDPVTYGVMTNWSEAYSINRHPLLAMMMFPLYLLNQGLTALTGYNCALFIAVALQTFCAFYNFIFLYRILREIIELTRRSACILSAFAYSLAYVIIVSIVPDHFVVSMMLLTLTLYIAGKKIKDGRQMNGWQTVLLFVITAGVSFNNGAKTFAAAFFTNGKRFFRPAYLLMAIIIPTVVLWEAANWQHKHFLLKAETLRNQRSVARTKAQKAAVLQAFTDTATAKDTAIRHQQFDARYKEFRARLKASNPQLAHVGKPIKYKSFWVLTDITTPRLSTAVENLMGEPILLHQKYVLEDVLVRRPVFVTYDHWWNYAVEVAVTLLLIGGIWAGRRERMLWMVLSFFGMDIVLHFILGFSIIEIYIMSPHWLMMYPVFIGYLLRQSNKKMLSALEGIMLLLTVCLALHNLTLLVKYLY